MVFGRNHLLTVTLSLDIQAILRMLLLIRKNVMSWPNSWELMAKAGANNTKWLK